ncbi:MAG: serine hydrolase [Reichenbachiella sp.]|uniref:serine hydrolase n=1 Tax=Reichenbachiella sp. TaxID=2184521 RepID=UPI003263C860
MKKLFIPFVVSLAFSFTVRSQSIEVDLKALDTYFEKMTQDWDVPSMSIGIVKDGELVFAKGYGVKEVGKKGKPDKNTLYAIASNSKAFTSAIIAQLVEEGKLDWNDKVRDHLPYFELYDSWVSANTTIRDILSHRVGLGTFSGDVIWYKADLTAEEIVRKVKNIPPAYGFRAGWGYSNVMYITAGEVIRKVTGKSWADNVKERLLKPLAMDRTITTPKELESKGNYATPHARSEEKNVPIVWEDWEEIGALGGLISSVEDLSKWMIMNMNHGLNGSDTLFSRRSRNMMWKPHNNFTVDHTSPNDFNRHFSGYGLGWGLSDYQGNLRVGHTGGYDGMLSAFNMIPDQKLGVIVLTNGMKSPMMAATYYALDKFLGVDEQDWSKNLLNQSANNEDTRIAERKTSRVEGTLPSLDLEKYTGTYLADIYGDISVSLKNGELRLNFEHAKALSATLRHWHYDVWEIDWDIEHAWFSFGTVQFNMDNNLKIEKMTFDVPNDDIFFEELKPIKIK